MRAVVAVTIFALFGADYSEAGDAELPMISSLQQLSESEQSHVLHYDIESLTATLELSLGWTRVSFSIANALELPEYEAPGGAYLDEAILLTHELNGIEVDTGDERMVSLTFSFSW